MGKRIVILFCMLFIVSSVGVTAAQLSPTEQLGKFIFFDENLSIRKNQSCASCHKPNAGWTGPDSHINNHGAVYEGSIPGRFGNRKPPSAAYAAQSPILFVDKKGLWTGGNFWDGRATGEKLGNPAADQAQGPFLNPAEQALPDPACVVYRVCNATYPISFESVWGTDTCDISWPSDIDDICAVEGSTVPLSNEDKMKSQMAYDFIGLSIAAYEASREVNPFDSRFDKGKLSREEKRGFALFKGKGKCALCHIIKGKNALFTDFTYDNLGIPKNPENPVYTYDPGFVDYGLGGFLMAAGFPAVVYAPEMGKVKVPTLRNVDLRPDPDFVKSYGHNGYFKSLESIVHFYNTRDVKPRCPGDYTDSEAMAAGCWPPPEVAENVNTAELGNLGLSPEEEAAIVAFLKTLSDQSVLSIDEP